MAGDRLNSAAFEGLRRMFNYVGGGLIYVRAPWLQGVFCWVKDYMAGQHQNTGYYGLTI